MIPFWKSGACTPFEVNTKIMKLVRGSYSYAILPWRIRTSVGGFKVMKDIELEGHLKETKAMDKFSNTEGTAAQAFPAWYIQGTLH